ncbi:MAG: hypothetical protein QW303_02565 [Nitrososphaerota archaeon]
MYQNQNVSMEDESKLIRDYYNPYECGAKQNLLDPCYIPYIEPMYTDFNVKFPNKIGSVNVESLMIQRKTTRLPGKRKMVEKEINRFEFLPFNPQDPDHIVWSDMPRGGFATRNDRLEIKK